MKDVYLVLENGVVFKGKSFGFDGEAEGEIVISTRMTGYMETLTDPAHSGQLVVETFPLIGNYGVISEEKISDKVHLKAYIVSSWCEKPSNFRCEGNLDIFLRENEIPGLYDIDTRALTHILRENGTMKAKVTRHGN